VRVLIIGGAGMLGNDVAAAAAFVNHDVVAPAQAELDVTDADAVHSFVFSERPEAVVNCAGYTNVDGAEDDLETAMAVNAEGARNVAAAAALVEAKVVYVSTDYVFDGTKPGPYIESDEPRPLSIYGRTKLAGEHETAAANPRHFVARTSWLFGTAGGNFVETMLALGAEHGEVLVVRDQVGSPTYTAHLGEALIRLLDTEAYGVHHLAATGECSWYEFAQEIFSQAGLECTVMSLTTTELARPAPRPPYSVLATEIADAIRLPAWTEGLAAYLAARTVRT
jgi:dTDP-4-dehydrorhamnose reductase